MTDAATSRASRIDGVDRLLADAEARLRIRTAGRVDRADWLASTSAIPATTVVVIEPR